MNSVISKKESIVEKQFIAAQATGSAAGVQSQGARFEQVKNLFQAMGLLGDRKPLETQYLMIVAGHNFSNAQGLIDLGSLNRGSQPTPVVVLTLDEKSERIEACKYVGGSDASIAATPKALDVTQQPVPLPSDASESMRLTQSPIGSAIQAPYKLEQLTAKQNSVLAELAQGYSNKEIARSLNLSDETVRTHLAGIFRRLGVRNRTQATKRYLLGAQTQALA